MVVWDSFCLKYFVLGMERAVHANRRPGTRSLHLTITVRGNRTQPWKQMSTSSVSASHSIARGRPRLLFATLMLGFMSQGLALSALVSALPQMAHDLGSRGQFIAQMTMAVTALGLMLGALASGWILEKVGTRITLLASMLTYGIAGAGGLVLRDPVLLLTTRFAVGFTSACMVTTCVWGIAAEYEGNRRAKTLGFSIALSSVTSVTGTVLGGYLAQYGGWSLAFLEYPIFGLVGFLLAFGSVKQVRPELERVGETSRPYLKRLLPFYLLVALLTAVTFMGSTQFAFLLEEDGIRSPAARSLIMGTITIAAAVTSFYYGFLQQRLNVLGTFTLALTCMAVALAVIGRGVNPAYAILGAALMGIFSGLLGPYGYYVVAEHTDAYSRSRAIGLLSAFAFLGGFLNVPVFETMSNAIGLRNVFLVAALLMAVLALCTGIILVRRRSALREHAASL
jgi:MFS family permease